MNENKQSVIGFVLIALIFLGFMLYTNHEQTEYRASLEAQEALVIADEAAPQPAESAATDGNATATEQPAQPQSVQSDGFIADAESVEEVVVENDVLKIRFTTKGAQIADVTLKEYTKYAPKEERNTLVQLFDPGTARFDMSFYLKNNLRNVKVNTIEHNFELLPIRNADKSRIVTMRLPVGEDASLDYVYTIYDELRPERDYLVDFEVRLNNLAPMMANQTSIGIDWSNRSYQNERSYKTENTYTTIAYHFPNEIGIEDLGMATGDKDKNV
ncbi:MAG: YidC/Oxa1 family insertase periplasmic-domain containing protein, partial [Alistipes sp.]|nr:YidC/Oxa1 family insertase periplasmic-domain containing protein [Alistipes sp.]